MVSTGAGTLEILVGLQRAIADLHEAVGVVPRERFQTWALNRVGELLPFARAAWGTRHTASRATHSLAVHGRFLDAPGSNLSTTPTEWRLVAAVPEPSSPLETVLLAERMDAEPPFTRDERDAFMLIAQHLVVASRNCQRLDVLAKSAASPGLSVALIDSLGWVIAADRGFQALVAAQWPRNSGTQLPDALRSLIARSSVARDDEDSSATFGGTCWQIERSGDALYLLARPLGALSRLTGREQAIAAAIIDGCSYEESATRLGISVNTLRNAVARIYRKLGVNNRLDLARRARFDTTCADGCGA